MIQNSIKNMIYLLLALLLLTACTNTNKFWQPAIWNGKTNYVNRVSTVTEDYSLIYNKDYTTLTTYQSKIFNELINKHRNIQKVFVSTCLNDKNKLRLKNICYLIRKAGFEPIILHQNANKCQACRSYVNISIKRLVVIPPVCHSTPSKSDYYHIDENFGCATVHNLGVMIVNPNDLYAKPGINPFSGQRAVSSVERYNKDQVKKPESMTTSDNRSGVRND